MSKKTAVVKKAGTLSIAEIWDNGQVEAKLKEIYGKSLTPVEWMTFKALSKSADANPFRGEIWTIVFEGKNGRQPSIFLGKNQFVKIATSQPDYDFHRSQAIYENDEFWQTETGIHYKSAPIKERGELLGAFSMAKKKGSSQANIKWVDIEPYRKKSPTWTAIPATMIEKVALSQNLKETWYDAYGGPGGNAYIDAEKEIIEATYEEIPFEPPAPEPKPKGESGPNYEELEILMLDKFCDINKVRSYLKTKGIDSISNMNAMQYEAIKAEVLAM